MERAIFTLFVLMIVALIAVGLPYCDDSTAREFYSVCGTRLNMFFKKKNTSVSQCEKIYKETADCYKGLWGNCGNGPVAKWHEHVTSDSQMKKVTTNACSHLKEVRTTFKCVNINVRGYLKCIKKATRLKTGLCGQWNALLLCNRKFLVKCPDGLIKSSKKMLDRQRPRGCRIKKDPSVTMTTKGM